MSEAPGRVCTVEEKRCPRAAENCSLVEAWKFVGPLAASRFGSPEFLPVPYLVDSNAYGIGHVFVPVTTEVTIYCSIPLSTVLCLYIRIYIYSYTCTYTFVGSTEWRIVRFPPFADRRGADRLLRLEFQIKAYRNDRTILNKIGQQSEMVRGQVPSGSDQRRTSGTQGIEIHLFAYWIHIFIHFYFYLYFLFFI